MWCGSVISQERVLFKVRVFAFYLRCGDGFFDSFHETLSFAVRFWPQWYVRYSPMFETTEQCVVGKLGALGVSDFLEKKRYEGVICSMLLALRGGGWGPISRKNSVT